jgi:hypothetical protein
MSTINNSNTQDQKRKNTTKKKKYGIFQYPTSTNAYALEMNLIFQNDSHFKTRELWTDKPFSSNVILVLDPILLEKAAHSSSTNHSFSGVKRSPFWKVKRMLLKKYFCALELILLW